MTRLTTQLLPALIVLSCFACGGASSASEATATPDDESGAAPLTRYEVGDTITYEYAGAFSEAPVVLTETIESVEGAQLRIRVDATRGDETRQWIQVVTDTEENRDANVIDALYEVQDGEEVLLENEGNRDLLRLYAWTLPPCRGPSEAVGSETNDVDVAGQSLSCECKTVTMTCADAPARMTTCDCPDLVWTHGGGRVVLDGQEEPFWSMTVTDQQ